MTAGIGARARFDAIHQINTRTPRKFDCPHEAFGKQQKISDFFGVNTFDFRQMREKLPAEIFARLLSTIESGKKLDPGIAGAVAHAIKEWSISNGVTHFCHWFQPQTGSTAEKHDAFLAFDDEHRPIERFSPQQLIQSEPDASSFPSGGMRTTFEARGYTAWDPSSPVFIVEATNGKTLCIPSVFISYSGDALDEKTCLLRSIEVVCQKTRELLELTGMEQIKRIIPTLGVEQEYFLIDRAFYGLRPDLVMTGRTLIGGQPPKGQQLEDHYFGSIATRVLSFMSEVEYELYKLGVPVKTRHNEVAPGQFELAPIFEEANIAVDHDQLVMETLRKVARRHHFAVLLHEKPFAGVNGSGKHNNWSLSVSSTDPKNDGINLLDPGKTPRQNLRFLLMLSAILKGVHRNAGLLRAAVASAGNDHRLGANEAPPAIISVFLGDHLNRILDEMESGAVLEQNPEDAVLRLGVGKLPEIMRDNNDRNRTSPFAFTGNKFEFRAVGASASAAFPVTMLNCVVADGIDEVITLLKEKQKSAGEMEKAILATVREVVRETKPIRFEGNNYSEDWVREAEKRGLPNLRKTPEALAQLLDSHSKSVLTRLGVFNEMELNSRFHVRNERYVKNLSIEVDTMRSMVDTMVLPAAFAYHGQLAQGAHSAKSAGLTAPQAETANRLSGLVSALQGARSKLESVFHKAEALASEEEKARLFSTDVVSAMTEVRSYCDEIESIVADDLWPLPKYREMLFLR